MPDLKQPASVLVVACKCNMRTVVWGDDCLQYTVATIPLHLLPFGGMQIPLALHSAGMLLRCVIYHGTVLGMHVLRDCMTGFAQRHHHFLDQQLEE